MVAKNRESVLEEQIKGKDQQIVHMPTQVARINFSHAVCSVSEQGICRFILSEQNTIGLLIREDDKGEAKFGLAEGVAVVAEVRTDVETFRNLIKAMQAQLASYDDKAGGK